MLLAGSKSKKQMVEVVVVCEGDGLTKEWVIVELQGAVETQQSGVRIEGLKLGNFTIKPNVSRQVQKSMCFFLI
jgi:hypothetical protein